MPSAEFPRSPAQKKILAGNDKLSFRRRTRTRALAPFRTLSSLSRERSPPSSLRQPPAARLCGLSAEMFNIKRFDPSQPAASPSTPTGGSTDALSSLAQKIEERRRKRKAGEAGLENDVPQPSSALSPPPPAAEAAPVTTAEWQPAPGESPAEREKRIKREKRAQKGGVSFDLAPRGPSGSSYVPPPPPSESSRMEVESGVGMGAGGIHPDRLGAPALAKEAKTGEPKEKTPARARYLKKKKNRAKGKKAGEPLAKPKRLKKARVAKPVDGAGSDGDSDGSSSEDEEERKGVEEAKRKEVLRKKEERKVKREAKKAEIRKLKAEGAEVPAAKPRVLPSSAPKVTTIVQPEPVVEEEPVSTEPTAEELQAAVEEEQRLARKEAKRLKRSTRRLSPAPPSPSTLIPTQVVAARSPSPIPDIEPIPQPEEPAPLLRLPSATRPAPPSAKTLSLLNVHASVRNKLVVDPEIKVKIDDPVLGLSERGRKRLGEMGIVEAFAGGPSFPSLPSSNRNSERHSMLTVQTSVLPILLGQANSNLLLYSPFSPPQDVCVSAPTGSGKTLSYVVPIIEVQPLLLFPTIKITPSNVGVVALFTDPAPSRGDPPARDRPSADARPRRSGPRNVRGIREGNRFEGTSQSTFCHTRDFHFLRFSFDRLAPPPASTPLHTNKSLSLEKDRLSTFHLIILELATPPA